MHSELLNLSLFISAIAKVLLMTGLLPGAILAAIFERCPFPFCVLRDSHDDDHDVRVPIERFTPFREQAELFKVSAAGQLAIREKGPATLMATSLSRKVRRYA
jgi:hypothetical protein